MKMPQDTSFLTRSSYLLQKLSYKPKTNPRTFSQILSNLSDLSPTQKQQFFQLRIRKCYSLLQSSNYEMAKEEISNIIKFANAQKIELEREEIEQVMRKAWIGGGREEDEEEKIKMFKECKMWSQEEQMLEYKEEEGFFMKWIKEWCG